MSLPGSDMDVVILGAGRDICAPAEQFTAAEKNAVVVKLQRLLEVLRRKGLVEGKGRLLAHARVPIVKVLLRLGTKSMSVDISMGVQNGAAAVELIQHHVMGRAPVRPLVIVLKAILKDRELNEVFTGGISSYVLFNMVSLPQGHPLHSTLIKFEIVAIGHIYACYLVKLCEATRACGIHSVGCIAVHSRSV